MIIKICGITRGEDADAAIRHGAHALGFVFWRNSPRFIDPLRAREIVRRLPASVTAVGVFVNQTAAEVNAIADQVGLGSVQLHGDETVSFIEQVNRPVIKSVPIAAQAAEADGDDIDRWPARVTLLVDVHDPVSRGGTGRTVDWERAAAVAARRPTLLAGGLRPENVAVAIGAVRPYGIDVSSGVELAPGIKDQERLEALFAAVRAAALSVERQDAR